jgi:membrane fusion protein, copper/silver efflux system
MIKYIMMKIKKIISNKYITGTLLVLAGLLLGLVIFHGPHNEKASQEQTTDENKKTIWTCAMHPQIRMDHPGKCPICGMDLIPLLKNTAPVNPDAVVMTEEGIKLAEVQTSIVSRQKPVKTIQLYGKIQADERLIQTQPAHIPGRIEKLFVNFTGEEVRQGQAIAQIYSPELVTAQKELMEALKMKEMQPGLLDATRAKLRQWKFTDSQIADIEDSGATKTVFDVYATVSGIVINKSVSVGDYVSQGAPLYEIADLSYVWALFDAYETDLPWIRKGDRINFTLQSQPGKEFTGKVSFIDPVINPQTRVASIRLEIPNRGNILKPDMFATGKLTAHLATLGNSLVIPQTSVLWTGTRSVVYVKLADSKEPTFIMREITLGPSLSNSFVVTDGLMEGEEIVTNGTFSVDASAQLEGKPSMMNPEGGKTNTMPGMIMPVDSISGSVQNKQEMDMHSAGSKSRSGTLNRKTVGTPVKLDISMDFTMQLNTVFDKYIVLKDAFVKSDDKLVKQFANEVLQALDKTDITLLKGEAMTIWMGLLPNLNRQLKQIASSDDLEGQRKTFSIFNDVFHKTIITFSLMGKTVYYQFCPMMNDNKGAYWLSETNEIRNPYYGESMLTCGETKDTLKY